MSSHFLSLNDQFRSTRWLLSTKQICNVYMFICVFACVPAHTHKNDILIYIYMISSCTCIHLYTHIVCFWSIWVCLYTYQLWFVGCQKNPGKKQRKKKSSIYAAQQVHHWQDRTFRVRNPGGWPVLENAKTHAFSNGSSCTSSWTNGKQQLSILWSYDSTNFIRSSGSEMETNHKTCLLIYTWNLYQNVVFFTSDDIGLRNLKWLFAVPYWYIFGTTLPVANFFR